MKKIIISVIAIVLVVVAYLGQVAYMGTLNQKVFELASQPNDFVSIEDMKFEKGFFTSKANFLMYIKTDGADLLSFGLGQMPIAVEVRFKNNVFAKDNVDISLENPLYELLKGNFEGKMTMDKVFLNTKASVSLFGNIKLITQFTDIDIEEKELIIKLKNFIIQSQVDLNSKIYDSKVDLEELFVNVPQYYGADKIALKNLHINENLDKGVGYSEYMEQMFLAGKRDVSIEQMQIYDVNLLDIKANSQSSSENGLGKASTKLTIKSVSSALAQMKLDDISSTFEVSNVSLQALFDAQNLEYIDFEELIPVFFSSKPSIELKSLTFNANGRKVSSNGVLKGTEKGYEANFFTESEAVPSEIIPPLQLLGINELFVEKEGKYYLDFALQSDFINTKMSLNGKDMSDTNDNAIISVD